MGHGGAGVVMGVGMQSRLILEVEPTGFSNGLDMGRR